MSRGRSYPAVPISETETRLGRTDVGRGCGYRKPPGSYRIWGVFFSSFRNKRDALSFSPTACDIAPAGYLPRLNDKRQHRRRCEKVASVSSRCPSTGGAASASGSINNARLPQGSESWPRISSHSAWPAKPPSISFCHGNIRPVTYKVRGLLSSHLRTTRQTGRTVGRPLKGELTAPRPASGVRLPKGPRGLRMTLK